MGWENLGWGREVVFDVLEAGVEVSRGCGVVFSWWEVSLEFWNLEGRRLKAGMGFWGFEDWNSGLLGVEAPMKLDHRSVAHDFLRLGTG